MTAVRVFTPPNRLAKVLIDVGGRTSREIVETADAQLEVLEAPLRRGVSDRVARITALRREGDEALRERVPELGAAALAIAEIAGAARLSAVGEAARGLCAMVDAHTATGLWHAEAVAVHIAVLTLLGDLAETSPAQSNLVLVRLQVMRAAIGIPD